MSFKKQLSLLIWKNITLHKRQLFRVGVEIVWPLCLFLILVAVKTRPDLIKYKHECHFDGRAMPSAGLLPFAQTYICAISNKCYQNVTVGEIPGVVENFNQSLLTRSMSDLQTILQNSSNREMFVQAVETFRILEDLYHRLEAQNVQGDLRISNFLLDPGKIQQEVIRQNVSISSFAVEQLQNASFNMIEFVKLVSARDDFGTLQWINDLQNFSEYRSMQVHQPENIIWAYQMLCNESLITRFLIFSDPASALAVQQEICYNLTKRESRQLFNDFVNNFNLYKFLREFEKYAKNNTDHHLDLVELIQRLRGLDELWVTIRSTESFALLSSNWENTLMQINNLELWTNNNDTLNTTILVGSISRIFCGRSEALEFGSSQQSKVARRLEDYRNRPAVEANFEELDASVSNFCKNAFKVLETNPLTRLIWKNILKSILLGVIPYTPDTPIVRKILLKASESFDNLRIFLRRCANVANDPREMLRILRNLSKAMTLLCSNLSPQLLAPILNQVNASDVTDLCKTDYAKFFQTQNESSGNTSEYHWEKTLNSTLRVMRVFSKYSKCFNFDKFVPYPNESALVEDSLLFVENATLLGALVFDMKGETEKLPTHVTYKIRMDADKVDSTRRIRDRWWTPGPRARTLPDMKYLTFGFIYLQDMIDNAIIREQTGQETVTGIFTQQFPYPCYLQDKFTRTISKSLPLFMVLAWIFSVAMIVKSIVFEKEKRLKEVMKIMGLGNGVHWLAWFCDAFLIMTVSIILLVMTLKLGNIMEKSNAGLLFLFMICFSIATISLCFLISVFFSRANLAAICGGFIYYILYLPYNVCLQWEDYMNTALKRVSCLSSNIAFGYGCSYIARYEEQAIGLQWSNVNSSPVPDDGFSMLQCMMLMLVDSIIYLILAWYIEAVFPGMYGIPRKWYFPLQKSYWLSQQANRAIIQQNLNINNEILELAHEDSEKFEKVSPNSKIGVSIKNLRKVYKQTNKVAVDGLNLNFYEGQITAFLGHNGAGKTTTMSILTGLFPPTNGTAIIYGHDIRWDMDVIRRSLAMCPQYNVLFEYLTVEEHLWFYAKLKGAIEECLSSEIEKMIDDVDLRHKRNELSTNLSGGMKRKLSVAISFIGGSKTVILDEPTAGVDPHARRAIWEILLKFREGRTIILTTHHMDEADVLGDRIAIISDGKLQCCGSSLFLKNYYGSGYYLTLVKSESEGKPEQITRIKKAELSNSSSRTSFKSSSPQKVDAINITAEAEDEGFTEQSDHSDQDNLSKCTPKGYEETTGETSFSHERLLSFIRKYIPNSRLVDEMGSELCYQLTHDKEANFEDLFADLEKYHRKMGISTYGISDTTLEEVFLRVTDDCSESNGDELMRKKLEEISESGRLPRPLSRLSFRKNRNTFLSQSNGVDSKEKLDEPLGQNKDECHGEGSYKLLGWRLTRHQFLALLIKRFHHQRKSKKGFLCEIILPAAFILLSMVLTYIYPSYDSEPPLELHPWHYVPRENDRHLYTFYSNDNPYSNVTQRFEKILLSRSGLGNRCLNTSVYTIKDLPCEQVHEKWKTFGPLPKRLPQCSCQTGVQVCPDGAAGPSPPFLSLSTVDVVYNMTGRNLSDWLLKTNMKFFKKRYGGLSFGELNPVANLNRTQMTKLMDRLSRAAFNRPANITSFWTDLEKVVGSSFTRNIAKVWFNNKGWAAIVTYLNVMNNIILRSYLPSSANPSNYGITTINHPMALTKKQLTEENIVANVVDVLIAICVMFALSFVPASFTLFLIEERVTNAKHLQVVSGINAQIYWLATLLWDLANYCIPATLCVLIFLAFDQEAYVSSTNLPCLIALLFLYGWAIIPMMYPFARLFDIPSTAFVSLSCANVFLGTVSTLATFILEMLQADDQELKYINDILKKVFLLLPQYCFGRGLVQMAQDQLLSDVSYKFGETWYINPFAWNKVGRNLLSLFILGIFFFIVNLLIEFSFFERFRKTKALKAPYTDDDVDVVRERERILTGGSPNDVLKIKNLSKTYKGYGKKSFLAVDHLCVGVAKGECFGLLGVNGAGKTTTFKMLTGEITPTTGDSFVNGFSIKNNLAEALQNIGYCPQFDALDSLLTGREHLELYARLRGVPENEVKKVANWAIHKLDLAKYADKTSETYSGGNKRKLSTAIALVGNPAIIFLDEPTSGMDPKARRFLWDSINNIVKAGRSVVLTSHSMEECEALCSRIAIMVNGRFQCLGSIQHLKNRFGDGYVLSIRMPGHNPDMVPVMKYVFEHFPQAVLKEKHFNILHYQLGVKENFLSKIFLSMENAKSLLNIEDYSVSQTTLDQVFINFANHQTDLFDAEVDVPAEFTYATRKYEHSPQGLGVNGDSPSLSRRTLDTSFEDNVSRTGSTVGLVPEKKPRKQHPHLSTYRSNDPPRGRGVGNRNEERTVNFDQFRVIDV